MPGVPILFIAFDATNTHIKRAAATGAIARHTVRDDSTKVSRPPTEAGERFVAKAAGGVGVPSVDAAMTVALGGILKEEPELVVDELSELMKVEALRRSLEKNKPDFVFISEFPTSLGIGHSKFQPDGYELMEELLRRPNGTALPRTQRMALFRKKTIAVGRAEIMVKFTVPPGVPESMLVLDLGGGLKIAGVHLSSRNTKLTGKSSGYAATVQQLQQFMSANKISGALGDFNFDVTYVHRVSPAAPTEMHGNVGAVPGSVKFLTHDVPAPSGEARDELFSSSTGKRHYMGSVCFENPARGVLSIPAVHGSEYLSDHSMIFAKFGVEA